MLYSTTYDSPIGALMLASDGESLIGLWLEGQKYYAAGVREPLVANDGLPVFAQVRTWLDRYFADDSLPSSTLSLALRGTAFQQRVWAVLAEIPYGHVRTYADIADELAREDGKEHGSARAVGTANGKNPISIILPCHRVVGSDGSLAGYAGGLDRKLWLLEHEHVDTSRFYRPKRGTAL